MSSVPREIAICGFMHSGVEWLEEIINFLTFQTLNTNQSEHKTTGYVNKLPASFSTAWFSVQNKLVFIVRNPKDVAAASYSVNMGYNEDVFGGFLENFVTSGSMSLSAISWFEHTNQWGECLKTLPTQSVHLVYFESLVQDMAHLLMEGIQHSVESPFISLKNKNFREELVKLYTFLELPFDAECLDKCCNTLNIDELIQSDGPQRKRRKTEESRHTSHLAITYESGTWKRLFTVGQSEQFDNYVRSAMTNSPIDLHVYL